MKWLNLVSLHRKMVLGIMLTAGLALLATLAAFLAIEVRASKHSSEQELAMLADILGGSATAALDFQEAAEAERLLGTLKLQPAVVEAAIFDRKDVLFAAFQREVTPKGLGWKPGVPVQTTPLGHIWLAQPIDREGETLGTIYLRSDLSRFYTRLRWGLMAGFLITLFIAGAAFLFALRIGRVVSEPILHLAEAARRVAIHGDSGERVARESQDEVGVLVDAYNGMLDELGERQARLREAQRMAKLASWVYHPETGALEWSEEAWRLLGLEAGAKGPNLESYLAEIPAEERPDLEKAFEGLLEQGEPFSLDHRLPQPDGSMRWVSLSAIAWSDQAGNRILRGTLLDITERKKTEASLRQTQKLESLGVLAGGIAHDFNNLLSAILGNLELARLHVTQNPKAETHLDKAEEISLKAANLTRQMLAYSGKGRFEVKPVDFSQVVREMTDLLTTSISKKVTLRYHLAQDLPPVVADLSQIQQVVMNLVINASEAMEGREGEIQLRTGSETLEADDLGNAFRGQCLLPGTYVSLEVEDNGKGMDTATLERIFDPFFTTKFTGRGLGLASMRGIVETHKGGIRVYSEVGKGTCFKLLFPAAQGAAGETKEESTYSQLLGSGHILVVDDEAELREIATFGLHRMGFQVIQAADGREALEVFKEKQGSIRLVLLDLTMPRMDGHECFQGLRALDRRVPVIFTSGFSEQESLASTEGQGPVSFLQKPYRITALAAKIQELLAL